MGILYSSCSIKPIPTQEVIYNYVHDDVEEEDKHIYIYCKICKIQSHYISKTPIDIDTDFVFCKKCQEKDKEKDKNKKEK